MKIVTASQAEGGQIAWLIVCYVRTCFSMFHIFRCYFCWRPNNCVAVDLVLGLRDGVYAVDLVLGLRDGVYAA